MTPAPQPFKIRRALISVSDKTGLAPFARALHKLGVELLSTGGSHKLLSRKGIPAREVSAYTGFPEIMGGRVKTLHPKIHGGILARHDKDAAAMAEHDIPPIDMVVVNLYPFAEVTAKPDCDIATAVEHIDIGGPAMLRAAAKNYAFTAVVTQPQNYEAIIQELKSSGGALQESTRYRLASAAFQHSAEYDRRVAIYLQQHADTSDSAGADFAHRLMQATTKKSEELRYGENPHQTAAVSRMAGFQDIGIMQARQVQGKQLSYNNIIDGDTALECVKSFNAPACVIVKHANPCGVAEAETLREAYERAFEADPTSAFGGVIALNRKLDAATAEYILSNQFVEVLINQGQYRDEAELQGIFQAKPNVRVMVCDPWPEEPQPAAHMQSVYGGLLVQDRDTRRISGDDLKVVSKRSPTKAEMQDMLFVWPVVKFVKSNAIVFAKERQTLGIGGGQTSRVYSVKIAAMKAVDQKLSLQGAVMASDAFFPFADGIEVAAKAGITAVIQPGGSKRDAEVIAAADKAGMAMVFTGIRHFRH